MDSLSKKMNEINTTLADSDIYADNNKQKLQQLLLDKSDFEKNHENLENAWLELTEELERCE